VARRFYDYFPPSRPKAAKGGIKSQSRGGRFAENWWAKRWIAVLEGFNIGARLGRGRSYARNGQVLSIDIEKGSVKARVQGSRSKPYEIKMRVKPLSESEWRKVTAALAEQAIFAAKLLAGEMPQEVEQVFAAAGLSLFPAALKDLETHCSCPDWSNPCKHIAAVYYLLGEEFDRNPFLIFKLRGMERDELLGGLGQSTQTVSKAERHESPSEPIAPESVAFWNGNDLPDVISGEVLIPPMKAALLKRLGNFPFWRGDCSLTETLEPFYVKASENGIQIFRGETLRGVSRFTRPHQDEDA